MVIGMMEAEPKETICKVKCLCKEEDDTPPEWNYDYEDDEEDLEPLDFSGATDGDR